MNVRHAQPHRAVRLDRRCRRCFSFSAIWSGTAARIVNWNFFTKLPAPVAKPAAAWPTPSSAAGKLLAARTLDWRSHRIPGRRLPGGIRRTDRAFHGALHGGPAQRRAVHRHRNFRLRLVVMPMHHFSTLAGGFALGMMMIPIVLRSTEEFLRDVPRSLREGAMALGANKWRTIATVVVPAASRGILTGDSAGSGARGRRNRAAAVHRLRQSLLEPGLGSADRFAAGYDLHLCGWVRMKTGTGRRGPRDWCCSDWCCSPTLWSRHVLVARTSLCRGLELCTLLSNLLAESGLHSESLTRLGRR